MYSLRSVATALEGFRLRPKSAPGFREQVKIKYTDQTTIGFQALYPLSIIFLSCLWVFVYIWAMHMHVCIHASIKIRLNFPVVSLLIPTIIISLLKAELKN